MSTLSVRYITDDVGAAVEFYTQRLGFELVMHPADSFAILSRGGLRLLLNAPGAGGGGAGLPSGEAQQPGGWNRFQLEVGDLAAEVSQLREAGVRFRSEVVDGVGGRQVLIDDPSGNPVELFEPHA